MSTKVYEAYKLRRAEDLWPFVRDARRKAEKRAQDILRKVLRQLASGVDTSSDAYRKEFDGHPLKDVNPARAEERVRLRLGNRFLEEAHRKQSREPYRNMFDFSASFVFREHGGRLYVIPHRGEPFGVRDHGVYGDVFDFFRKDPRLVDFSYWNNTDRLEGVTQRAWDARGRVWEAIDQEGWRDSLIVEVCAPDGLYLINPYIEMSSELARRDREADESASRKRLKTGSKKSP